jgi:DNA-binding NtrC family response regulator
VKAGNYTVRSAPENFASVSRERKKALIVDDEKDICYLLGNILKQNNIQPAFAGSLAEAERILQSSSPFYFVFLDNHLPDGFGVDQIKSWKERFPTVHFIMITAHDSGDEKLKAENDGADSFIGKPFSREIILKAIGKA